MDFEKRKTEYKNVFDNSEMPLKEIEEIEHKYLMKYWYFLKYYKSRPLKAGKLHGKARFNFCEVSKLELLEGNKKRVRIIHKNPNMSDFVKSRLSFYLENFDPHVDE